MGDKKIKLNINLEELVDAYEDSSLINIYYIDTKKNELIYYNDALGEPVEVRKKLDSYSDNDRYLYIPPRLSQDEFFIMKSFVYTIKDFNVAEKFHNALERKKLFKNFKSLMY